MSHFKNLKPVLVLLLFGFTTFAQNIKVAKPQNSAYYLNILNNAKDSLYNNIIFQFNQYLKQNPNDVLVCIEKCRLLELAYYNESEEYNPKDEEYTSYLDSISKLFPKNPDLLLYRTENAYGDSAIALCERILNYQEKDPETWQHIALWKVHEKLAEAYSYNNNTAMSIKYANKAMELNDTLDLSILQARNYIELKQNYKAIFILKKHLSPKNSAWDLSQKGKLLLDLGVSDKALMALKWSMADSINSYNNNDDLADAMIENGLYEAARVYLVKDTEVEWNRAKTLCKLFDYDMKYSSGDTAAASYQRMVLNDFMNDPVGIKRIRLFFKSPMQAWSFKDVLRVSLLLISFIVVFLIPYLWILPIHNIGNYYIKKGKTYSQTPFRWTLRHFWIASAGILIVDLLINLIFDHDNFFSITETDAVDEKVSLTLANMTLVIFTCYAIITLLLLKKTDYKFIFGNVWPKRKSILIGVGYALALRVCFGIYLKIYGLFSSADQTPDSTLSIIDNVTSVNTYYHSSIGFLMVVIIVPIYEEILFRGIFLTASEKYLRFFWANLLQATLFAAIHLDLKSAPFYLAFALIAGYQKRKAHALAPGIALHMTNNLIAFIAIMTLSAMQSIYSFFM